MVIAGAANGAHAAFVNLKPFVALFPQPDNPLTLILSEVSATAFDAYITRITLELDISPESNVTPDTPPTDVGNVHV